jgi:hypothetical protein
MVKRFGLKKVNFSKKIVYFMFFRQGFFIVRERAGF